MIMFNAKQANQFNSKWNQNQIRNNPNSAAAKTAQQQLDAWQAWKKKSQTPAVQGNPAQSDPAASQQQQGFFSAGNQFGQGATDAWQKQADWINQNQPSFDSLGKLPGADDFTAEKARVENEMFSRAKGDLDTRYQQESSDFEQRMANEGVDIGTPRYQREKELFERSRNQAYSDARFGAMQNAGAEQSRLFQDALSAHQQGASDTVNLRTMRINDLASILNPALTAQQSINQQREADANRNFTQTENNKQRNFTKRENALTRRAQGRNSGGGGGGALDINQLLGLIGQLTGENLKE